MDQAQGNLEEASALNAQSASSLGTSRILQKQNYKNTNRYRVWLSQADFDLQASHNSFDHASYEWACYQSVQAVEKALKAVIIHAGWRPPQTHKLGVLLSLCNQSNRNFEKVKFNFRKIESYTFIARYPFVYPGEDKSPHDLINKNDATNCIATAENILSKIIDFLNKTSESSEQKESNLENFYYTPEEVQSRLDNIINTLKGDQTLNVQKVILFGSFARQKLPSRTSTMDILIVANTSLNFIDRIEYVKNATTGSEPIVEPLVYTPSEFDFMLKRQGEGFLESAIEEGRTVFEGKTATMVT